MKRLLMVFLAILVFSCAYSQADSASESILELIRLDARYKLADNLSFNVNFYTQEKNEAGVYETSGIFGTYKISGYNVWSIVDSVEQVQNEQYVVIHYPKDSALFITKPDPNLKAAFPHNFLDSTFLKYEVNRMLITSYGSGHRHLSMFFNPESRYLSYHIDYSADTYLVSRLEINIKQNTDSSQTLLYMSNYQTAEIDKAIFSTSKYFTERDRKYIIAPAYYNYEILNPPNEIGYDAQY